MLDAAPCQLVARPAAPLPVARLVLGRPVDEVAALLPRLFNLCRAAQTVALRAALGLPADPDAEPIAAEVARDHLMRFCVLWPRHLDQAPTPLPPDWRAGGTAARRALFGPTGRLPTRPADFDAFLATGTGIAGALHRIADIFRAEEARADGLALVTRQTAFDAAAPVENSIAARHAVHPVMMAMEARRGRGPLWRAVGRAYDLEAALDGGLAAEAVGPGRVTVPAARGLYALEAEARDGVVIGFARVTPTDHLLAPSGILARTLASLPADRSGLAPLILDILDPCSPVRLEEAAHA